MPFEKAASMGTEKVIRDHATAGILITSDGSFGELGRESFPEAEKRTAEELQKTGKPCIALINSADPYGKTAVDTVELFEKEYGMAAMAVNLERLSVEDVQRILKKILYEFPAGTGGVLYPEMDRDSGARASREKGPAGESRRDSLQSNPYPGSEGGEPF